MILEDAKRKWFFVGGCGKLDGYDTLRALGN